MLAQIRADKLRVVASQRDVAREKIIQEIRRWRGDKADLRLLENLIFSSKLDGYLPLCNQPLRQIAIDAAIDTVFNSFSRFNCDNVYFITFCLDEGATWEDEPVVDLVALQRKVDKALRRLDVSGLAVVEVQSFRPIAGDGAGGKRLWFHVHALVRSKPGGLQLPEAEDRLNALPSFTNMFGARPVVIKPVGHTAHDFAQVAAYLFEYQHDTARRKRQSYGDFKLVSTRAGFLPSMAMRLAEIESQISIYDAVFSVGWVGRKLRQRWSERLEELRAATPGRPVHMGGAEEVAELYARLRLSNGSKRYLPCDIHTHARHYHSPRSLRLFTRRPPPPADTCAGLGLGRGKAATQLGSEAQHHLSLL